MAKSTGFLAAAVVAMALGSASAQQAVPAGGLEEIVRKIRPEMLWIMVDDEIRIGLSTAKEQPEVCFVVQEKSVCRDVAIKTGILEGLEYHATRTGVDPTIYLWIGGGERYSFIGGRIFSWEEEMNALR